MTENFVSLYKIRKKGEIPVLKLKCGWINGELNILVIEGNTAWSGKFTTEEIERFCKQLGITRDVYITECQQAFSGREAVEHFSFAVENNRFVWRKELGADTRVKFGTIKLSPVPLVQALEEFVDTAFETIERCRQEVIDAKNQLGYVATERTTLMQKLEEYTQNKKEIETILYSKFLCVLNAKKERIAILEKELSDLSNIPSDPCTSKAFIGKVCEPEVLENKGSSQHQASKNVTVQQKALGVGSASPVASISTSVIPLGSNIPEKYEALVSENKVMCIPSKVDADQKSQPLVKRSVNDFVSKQIKDVSGSIYSSEHKGKTTGKISEVICPIDLVSQKINTQSEVSLNNVNKPTIPKNNKKVLTSPAKQSKEFETISPLDLLEQSKPLTPSLVRKDTDSMPTNNSLKQPLQSVNMQDNNSQEFSMGRTNVCQESVVDSSGRADIDYVNTNYRSNTADATSLKLSPVSCTKSDTEGERNHYDSDTDVDEPEDVCKLSAKHRSLNGIPEDSSYTSLAGSETPEAKCDEIHQPEQQKAIENLLNDSQDTDSSSEEIPMAALPKRTRRSERVNKYVPITNKSVNHFTKLNQIRDKSQSVSENVKSVFYEQETQIVDTQKLLDELG